MTVERGAARDEGHHRPTRVARHDAGETEEHVRLRLPDNRRKAKRFPAETKGELGNRRRRRRDQRKTVRVKSRCNDRVVARDNADTVDLGPLEKRRRELDNSTSIAAETSSESIDQQAHGRTRVMISGMDALRSR